MKLAKLNTTAKVETQPWMRRLKVCAVVVKPCQTGPDHDGQAEQSDLAGPRLAECFIQEGCAAYACRNSIVLQIRCRSKTHSRP